MNTAIARSRLLFAGIAATVVIANVHSEPADAGLLNQAESRFKAIYDKEEFHPKKFQAEWLPDSSGYTVLETVPEVKESVRVRYDVTSGKRAVLDSAPKEKPGRSGNLSPDGKRMIVAEKGNLYVRDVDNDQKTPLTKNAPDGPVSNGQAVWSPDGNWIAFEQSDESDVKLRSELVPGDPSYPEVRQVRFARVGGTIPTLRVGVVDPQGKETHWLPIPAPAEGFYLGNVNWAGNSHELLIEKLSRFRNETLVPARRHSNRRHPDGLPRNQRGVGGFQPHQQLGVEFDAWWSGVHLRV